MQDRKYRKPVNSRASHKHMDGMLTKAVAALGNSFSAFELARWFVAGGSNCLTPCERYELNVYILNWG